MEQLAGSHMVFIAAGMGGGTGTGAAPVIARAVREAGILTVGVVTKPFALEGDRRMRVAEKGITELQQFVHTLIVIPNQNLFRVANDRTTMSQAFAMADEVLHAGVRGVTDLIVMPGLINLDFADIKSVITEMGKAMMGTGEAEGEDRAMRAADMAISNPLLDDVTMKGAKGVLINITGGPDLMLFEVEQAANRIRAEVDPDANIIFGNTILEEMEGRIRVSVVATGIDAEHDQDAGKGAHPASASEAAGFPHRAGQAHAPAVVNPVQAQVDSLAAELNAAPVTNHGTSHGTNHGAAEVHTLGGKDSPIIEEPATQAVTGKYPATENYRPLSEQPLAYRSQPEKKTGWSLFGRKKAVRAGHARRAAAGGPSPRHGDTHAAAASRRTGCTPARRRGSVPRSWHRRAVRDTGVPAAAVQLIVLLAKAPLELSLIGLTGKKFPTKTQKGGSDRPFSFITHTWPQNFGSMKRRKTIFPPSPRILNHTAATTTASWHEYPKSDAEMAEWFAARKRDFTVLAARDASGFLGYATYGPFRAPSGYRTHGRALHLCARRCARPRHRQGAAGGPDRKSARPGPACADRWGRTAITHSASHCTRQFGFDGDRAPARGRAANSTAG